MSYPRNLLDSAVAISQVDPQTQANLRRAVSAAYYALFHFLIEEACGNWIRPEQRGKLGRAFEDKQMSDASTRCVKKYKYAAPGTPESHLHSVASAFRQLQIRRHTADYDLSGTFSDKDVDRDIL